MNRAEPPAHGLDRSLNDRDGIRPAPVGHWFGDAIAFCLTAASCWPHSQEGAILAAGLDHGAIEGDPDRAVGGVRRGRLGTGKVGLRGSINVAFAVLIGVAISDGTSCFQVSWSSENLESWKTGILDA